MLSSITKHVHDLHETVTRRSPPYSFKQYTLYMYVRTEVTGRLIERAIDSNAVRSMEVGGRWVEVGTRAYTFSRRSLVDHYTVLTYDISILLDPAC